MLGGKGGRFLPLRIVRSFLAIVKRSFATPLISYAVDIGSV